MRFILSVTITILFSVISGAHASSPWASGLGYKARLVDGALDADGSFQAALEVVLEDGWKTYWRVPGENGIPPSLNFQNSDNLKDVKVHWPAPVLFRDSIGLSIGYKHHVVLPFTITPSSKDKEVNLNLSAFFGVCSEICVPVDATLSVRLDPDTDVSGNQTIIDEAMVRVPVQSSLDSFNIEAAVLETQETAEHIDLMVNLPQEADHVTILVEGPQDWYFSPYQASLDGENLAQGHMAKIAVHRYVRKARSGNEKLRVTVIADGVAIEKVVTLQ